LRGHVRAAGEGKADEQNSREQTGDSIAHSSGRAQAVQSGGVFYLPSHLQKDSNRCEMVVERGH
jgi:hypothetical protein